MKEYGESELTKTIKKALEFAKYRANEKGETKLINDINALLNAIETRKLDVSLKSRDE